MTEVYRQLEAEVQDPSIPADVSSDLVVHMLQLQAEGLTAAQGADPLALLLAAREQQFTATMQVCGVLCASLNLCGRLAYAAVWLTCQAACHTYLTWQVEGLTAAQGADPLALLLAAREQQQFTATTPFKCVIQYAAFKAVRTNQ